MAVLLVSSRAHLSLLSEEVHSINTVHDAASVVTIVQPCIDRCSGKEHDNNDSAPPYLERHLSALLV